MTRIVLCGIGSLGDIYPYMAIAEALAARGAEPVIATMPGHAERVRAAGLEALECYPEFSEMLELRGLDAETLMARASRDAGIVFDFTLPYTLEAVRTLKREAGDAAVIVGHSFAAAAEIAAGAIGCPFVPVILHPLTVMSAYDPPVSQRFGAFAPRAGRGPSLWWNRMMVALALWSMSRRYGPRYNEVRAAAGLGPLKRAPVLRFEPGHPRTLALFTPLLATRQPDAEPGLVVTGAPFMTASTEALDPQLEAFLAEGSPPLVFTLGSAAVLAPGTFYDEAVALARRFQRRAVLVGAPDSTAEGMADAFVTPYAPHEKVFPAAAVTVHQGGVGTLSRALSAGRPQLVVPHAFDQFDNADRLRRMGVAETLVAERFSAARAEPLLSRLLTDPDVTEKAGAAANAINAERGAEVAAEAILAVAARHG